MRLGYAVAAAAMACAAPASAANLITFDEGTFEIIERFNRPALRSGIAAIETGQITPTVVDGALVFSTNAALVQRITGFNTVLFSSLDVAGEGSARIVLYDDRGVFFSQTVQLTKAFKTFILPGAPVPAQYLGVFRESGSFAAIDNILVADVPEPATWAMMIAGLGLAGGALRSRRRPAVATA